ncbi:helix-hairpin-helix domain-containing protein [bacterium]|nr:helix-hairpin-helix domain-containing protein [bacterium]
MTKRKFNLRNFGFSLFERRAIWFLLIVLLIGVSIRLYRNHELSKQIDLRVSTQLEGSLEKPNIGRSSPSADNPLDINLAGSDELELLPGIGPVRAMQIINYRQQNGHFGSIDELRNVPGIGPKTVEKLQQMVFVDTADRQPE